MLNESDIESLQSSIQSFFEGNYNETWNATLNQFDALVANLSLYISCFEFNKFWGMPNELELEKLGIQLVERKQLWAALVFTNFPSNQKACGPCPEFFCKFQDAKIWILNIETKQIGFWDFKRVKIWTLIYIPIYVFKAHIWILKPLRCTSYLNLNSELFKVQKFQFWYFTQSEHEPLANQKTDDLPNFIQYKIRMDADTVDSTRFVEDRISRPIPRRRPPIDLKYLYLGFSFLQVSCTICNLSLS